jgi:hypothetical protein
LLALADQIASDRGRWPSAAEPTTKETPEDRRRLIVDFKQRSKAAGKKVTHASIAITLKHKDRTPVTKWIAGEGRYLRGTFDGKIRRFLQGPV